MLPWVCGDSRYGHPLCRWGAHPSQLSSCSQKMGSIFRGNSFAKARQLKMEPTLLRCARKTYSDTIQVGTAALRLHQALTHSLSGLSTSSTANNSGTAPSQTSSSNTPIHSLRLPIQIRCLQALDRGLYTSHIRTSPYSRFYTTFIPLLYHGVPRLSARHRSYARYSKLHAPIK